METDRSGAEWGILGTRCGQDDSMDDWMDECIQASTQARVHADQFRTEGW